MNIRPEIAEDFARIYRKGVDVLEQACDKTRVYHGECKYGHKISIPYPDVRGITAALQFLADQGIGRPAQQAAPPTNTRPVEDLEQATDEELLQLLAQTDVTPTKVK